MKLDDLTAVRAVDVHDAAGVMAAFPRQCREATALAPDHPLAVKRPALVVLAGMGGSAASGDLLAACAADRLETPIVVHRGYGLPAVARDQSLVVASSYSGETAEVLSAARTALERGVPVVAVTTGGRLGALAARHGLPRVTLPSGLMPRMALGYLLFPALRILREIELPVVSDDEAAEALEVVDAFAAALGPERPTTDNEAKRLAVTVGLRVPVFYGGPATGAVAYRWKTDVEENAKAFALAGTLPEMNHNEIEAWRAPRAADFHAVLLRDHDEPPEIARRFALLGELIGPAAGGLSEAWSRGRGRLARLLSLAYLGQWTSYYLAVLRGVDPWSVPMLDELKRRLQA